MRDTRALDMILTTHCGNPAVIATESEDILAGPKTGWANLPPLLAPVDLLPTDRVRLDANGAVSLSLR